LSHSHSISLPFIEQRERGHLSEEKKDGVQFITSQ